MNSHQVYEKRVFQQRKTTNSPRKNIPLKINQNLILYHETKTLISVNFSQ